MEIAIVIQRGDHIENLRRQLKDPCSSVVASRISFVLKLKKGLVSGKLDSIINTYHLSVIDAEPTLYALANLIGDL